VQSRDKCGTVAKPYDICLLKFAALNLVCGTDKVTYRNVFDMACFASSNSVGKLIDFSLHNLTKFVLFDLLIFIHT
jgi:hypothetical protein